VPGTCDLDTPTVASTPAPVGTSRPPCAFRPRRWMRKRDAAPEPEVNHRCLEIRRDPDDASDLHVPPVMVARSVPATIRHALPVEREHHFRRCRGRRSHAGGLGAGEERRSPVAGGAHRCAARRQKHAGGVLGITPPPRPDGRGKASFWRCSRAPSRASPRGPCSSPGACRAPLGTRRQMPLLRRGRSASPGDLATGTHIH
jgi:hypothetical protein